MLLERAVCRETAFLPIDMVVLVSLGAADLGGGWLSTGRMMGWVGLGNGVGLIGYSVQ